MGSAESRRIGEWRKQNPEKSRAISARYRDKRRERGLDDLPSISREKQRIDDPSAFLLKGVRDRASSSRIPFNITKEDIPIPDTCPVLGIPLDKYRTGGNRQVMPSVDRIKPHLGYVKGNVAVISLRANRLKQDATLEEVKAIASYIERHMEGVDDEHR